MRFAKPCLSLSASFVVFSFVVSTASAQPCDPIETAKLLASDGEMDDHFGNSVSISGDTAIVGANGDDDRGKWAGSAYIFQNVDGVWTQQTKLFAADAEPYDTFGLAVSISGDTAVVGAYWDNDRGDRSGSAYIFKKKDDDWMQVAKLLAPDGEAGDNFGVEVSISGDHAIVGEFRDGDLGIDSGSAYVFERIADDWTLRAKLRASDGAEGDRFGRHVAINGDTAIVGAYEDDDRGPGSGSAYIFEKIDGNWNQVAKLLASDGAAQEFFGTALSINADLAVVGAFQDNDLGKHSGSAYVFGLVDGVWKQVAKLLASDGAKGDKFGFSVSLSGDTVIVGARYDDDPGEDSGAAYIFKKIDGVWIEVDKLEASDGGWGDSFGFSVSLSGDTAIVGALYDNDLGYNSGSAYVFDLNCAGSDCLDLAIDNLVAGERALFAVSKGTPGARAATVYGLHAGQTIVNNYAGYCATFGIKNINQSKILGGLNRTFDANGEIAFGLRIPGNLAGQRLFFQSTQRGTCPDECMSNLVEMAVQ